MIRHELMEAERVLVVSPEESLRAEDFEGLAAVVDPFIESHGGLAGLMIEVESFPGWSDFAGLLAHLRFVREHHREIARVAAVTDDDFLSVLPSFGSHFVAADVRHFAHDQREEALAWLTQPSK